MPCSITSRSSSSSSEFRHSDAASSPPELSHSERELPLLLEDQTLPADDNKDYVLVLGGLGYIGSHTTLELLHEGFNVAVVDDLSNSHEDVLPRVRMLATKRCMSQGKPMPTLRFHALDYTTSAMRHLLACYSTARSRISAVIHFAAFKSVVESIHNPLAYYRNNLCGLVDLLITLQEFGIRNFVFSSSATVYGAKANEGKLLREEDVVHFDERTVDEHGKESLRVNGALGITNPYGRTKYFAEAVLADVAQAEPLMRITALRYFNPVGCHPSGLLREDPRQKPTNLFPVVASVVEGRQRQLEVFGSDWNTRDGTAVRDFVHVVDLAQGHIAAVRAATLPSRQEAFRVYNLGTGNGMTVAEVVESFEAAAQRPVPTIRAPRRAGDVGSCVAATARAERELGWRATRTVDDCARDAWAAIALDSCNKVAI